MPCSMASLFTITNYTPDKLELILLNVFPIMGPIIINAAITTIATKTKIKAYSTSPCPFSFSKNSIEFHLLFCLALKCDILIPLYVFIGKKKAYY
jgi:hypothetical protein